MGVGKNWKIANVEAQIESLCEHSLKETFICTLRMNALNEHVVQFCLLFFPFLSSASVYYNLLKAIPNCFHIRYRLK